MRIACFLPHLGISGGLGVQCRMFLDALHVAAPRWNLEVMVPRDPSALFPKSGIEPVECAIEPWGKSLRLHPIDWPKDYSLALPLDPVLGNLLKSLKPDLVFSSYYSGFQDPQCPQWVLYHDAGFLEFPARFGAAAPARLATLEAIKPALSGLVCISQDARERICKGTGLSASKTEVIWHCLTDLDPRSDHPVDANAKNGELWPDGLTLAELGHFWFSPVGAATGFNRARKNMPALLGAFREAKHLPVKLVIASTGVLDRTMLADLLPPQEIEQGAFQPGALSHGAWISGDGRIVILPNLERKPFLDTMASARGVVYPSRYEGFGLPTIEAMALGLPLVASRATSIPEIVEDCGILVDPDKPEQYTEAMASLEKDRTLARDLGQKGKQRAAHHFLPNQCGEKWRALFERTFSR